MKATFIFAHGAGADSQSNFMQTFAELLSDPKIQVITFDFPYMLRRQQTGKKSPPDRMDKLIAAFKTEIEKHKPKHLFIGGKSMGGRVASMIADEVNAKGLLCFGYPFNPPGKTLTQEKKDIRIGHLKNLHTPSLIIQGTRDTFGKPEQVADYELSNKIELVWIDDGDHSLNTLKRSALNSEQTWQLAAKQAKQFILNQL